MSHFHSGYEPAKPPIVPANCSAGTIARRLDLELVDPPDVPADAELPGSDGQAPVELEVDAGRHLTWRDSGRCRRRRRSPRWPIAAEQRAPVVVRGETGIERGVEAVTRLRQRVHERDRVVDLDPVPVDRELQVAEPGRLESRAHDDAGVSVSAVSGSRSGLPPTVVRIVSPRKSGSSSAGTPCAMHSASTCCRSGPLRWSTVDAAGLGLEDEATSPDVPGRNNSKIDGRGPRAGRTRAGVGGHRLIQQLGLPGVDPAGGCIVGMTVSEHGFERLDARQVRQERDRGLDVHIGVVVVGIDVVGGFKADDVRTAVRQDSSAGLRPHGTGTRRCDTARRSPCAVARGQRRAGRRGRRPRRSICRTSASMPASTAM